MSGTAKHYISLFTGAGGLDIGFNEAGFHGLLASDIMPQAKETFILNYPDEPSPSSTCSLSNRLLSRASILVSPITILPRCSRRLIWLSNCSALSYLA